MTSVMAGRTEPRTANGALDGLSTVESLSIGNLAGVEEWLGAADRRHGERIEQLSHAGRDCRTPRQHPGPAVFSDWLTRAGSSAQPLRRFCNGDGSVVVKQDARWAAVATGQE